jgi:radical SAM protein with 4Fe4S-binding SPASM domain
MPGSSTTISGEEFGEFMIRLWKTWEMKGRSLSLSPIQSFADYFRNSCKRMPESLLCAFSKNCAGSHVGIDYDLNVAACGRRLDSRAFLGNLRNDSLIHILENDEEMVFFSKRTDILHRKEPCSLCNYFMLCHGGCPDDAFLGSGRMDEPYPLCAGYRKLFEAMKTTARSISKPHLPAPGTFHGKEKKKEALCTLSLKNLPDPPFSWDRLWMLPDPEGAWLQFDSGLKDRVGKGRRRQLIQLWCYNRQVKSLMMWEDLLRTRDTWVCLFEPEGLEPAMNILNSLGATVFLDVVSIRRKGGRELLERAVNRLTSDPVWQIQVYPFSDLILRVINHRSSGFVDRFDLAPGRFRVTVLGEVNGVSEEIVESASRTGGASPSEWVSRRAGCLPCKHFGICGGRFGSDSVDGCPQDVRSMVDTIVSVAEKMKTVLPSVSMET